MYRVPVDLVRLLHRDCGIKMDFETHEISCAAQRTNDINEPLGPVSLLFESKLALYTANKDTFAHRLLSHTSDYRQHQ